MGAKKSGGERGFGLGRIDARSRLCDNTACWDSPSLTGFGFRCSGFRIPLMTRPPPASSAGAVLAASSLLRLRAVVFLVVDAPHDLGGLSCDYPHFSRMLSHPRFKAFVRIEDLPFLHQLSSSDFLCRSKRARYSGDALRRSRAPFASSQNFLTSPAVMSDSNLKPSCDRVVFSALMTGLYHRWRRGRPAVRDRGKRLLAPSAQSRGASTSEPPAPSKRKARGLRGLS